MKIFAGYGSTKDISVYTSIGLPPSQIHIVGRPSKKMQHQCQVPFHTQPPLKIIILNVTLVRSNPDIPTINKKTILIISIVLSTNSSSQRDMQLICPSWSTTTDLDQPNPAAHAWCSAKAALA